MSSRDIGYDLRLSQPAADVNLRATATGSNAELHHVKLDAVLDGDGDVTVFVHRQNAHDLRACAAYSGGETVD
jgi:hypothetical protein